MISYESFISLRYLMAKRKQTFISVNTVISIAGIGLGVAALIVVLSVMNGFEAKLRDKMLGLTSHIVLMEYGGMMKNHGEVMKNIVNIQGVIASTPFTYGQAMIKSRDKVTGIVVRGIEPSSAGKVINLGKMQTGNIEALAEDAPSSNPSNVPGVIIGIELAQNLGLTLFDTAEIVSPLGIPTPMGLVPKIKKFRVVGIFESGFYEYDSSLAFLSLHESQKFLNMEDTVTGVEIKIQDINKAPAIADTIENLLGYPYWARTWMELNKNLFSALRLEKRVMFIILSLIVLVAAFNIITTLIMVVMEKTKDIAILKSMGATAKSIMKIFMIQGLIIGFIGTIAGTAIGLLLAIHLEGIATFIENLLGIKIYPKDVYYLNELPSQVNYGDVAFIIVITMMICFIVTIYPSWRASCLDPAEALRYE